MQKGLEEKLRRAVRILDRGGVIVYPTETVYGLGGNALNEGTAKKIFRIKGREVGKAVIVLVRDLEMARRLAELGNSEQIVKKYWPGPLTGVFRSLAKFPSNVVSKSRTVAIRISPHPFVQKLFKFIDFPLISTSANKSGENSCSTIEEVKISLGTRFGSVDYTVDFGPLPISRPSTVVDFTTPTPKILRPGALEFDS